MSTSPRRKGGRRRSAVATAFISIGTLVVGVFAALQEGVATTDVELHDGSVWLTNHGRLLVGRLNHESLVLNAGLSTVTADYDVLQAGDVILVHDRANSTLAAVSPSYVVLDTGISLPSGSEVALGDQTIAILDPADGRLWVTVASQVAGLNLDEVAPVATLGVGAHAAVGPDGVVRALSAETGEVTTVSVDANGLVGAVSSSSFLDGAQGDFAFTVVGDAAVALDASRGLLFLPGGSVSVPDNGTAVLQQASSANDVVAVATSTSLILQPLDGSAATVTSMEGRGTPAAPVFVNGCVYAAWAGSGQFLRDCGDNRYDLAQAIDGALPSSAFVFRVNRNVVVLNDYLNGGGWIADTGMERVANWDDLFPPPVENPEEVEPEPDEEINTLPDRSKPNIPPVAEDDAFGARAGRTTVLPIIDNDSDEDGDLLSATVLDASGVVGVVQPIRGGDAVQVVIPETAEGLFTFTYRVSDGRGGVDDATVTVTVHPKDVNEPPAPQRKSIVSLEGGATISYNVLPDWVDPDGDTLFLRNAGENSVDTVEFSPDGTVTITANPDVPGTREVPIVVSDGRADATGTLRVDVYPAGTRGPLTNGDHVVTAVDRPVVVSPLGNDVSRSGLPLRLAQLSESNNATVIPDWNAGTFSFSASAVGTYYVVYRVTDGPNEAVNLVRIDVIAEHDSSLPPVAVNDVALVAPGRDVLVDVLANDSDPSGAILVVQSVEVPDGSGLAVAVLEHRLLRVTNIAGITEPVTLRYNVSNGTQSATGEVTVLPVDPPEPVLAPIAVDDRVVVRTGDIATIAALDNDWHPNGEPFTLLRIVDAGDPAVADVFVSEDRLRVKAGPDAGTTTITYEIVDAHGQRASATLAIRVRALDDGENAAPRPENVTTRVLSGQEVRILLPLEGIDPDGDSVTLIGASSAPTEGRVVQVGQDWLVYEAYEDGFGGDSFTYTVRDRLGAEASATVTIGVAPQEHVNHKPITVKDQTSLRARHSISVPVLVNDSDPDADVIWLDPAGLVVPAGILAEVSNDRIVVVSDAEGTFTIQYRVRDTYGATATGALQVKVDNETPEVAPIARDDRVTVEDIDGMPTVDVPVLANDEDPDGVASQLEITVDPLEATVNEDKTVTLAVLDAAQIVEYTVTDPDGHEAKAFILVPGLGDLPPSLVSGAPIEVISGETREIRIADFVRTGNGNPPLLTRAESVFAAHANGDSLIVDDGRLVYTSAEGYFGNDALTFEVTDGRSVDDPEGRLATITIPIHVYPAVNQPPSFRNGYLEVAPGGEAVGLDLRLLAADPDKGDLEILSYELSGKVPDGFSASMEGSTLLVTAGIDTLKDTEVEIGVSVTDGDSDPVDGFILVHVVSSTERPPEAYDDYVDDARPGTTVAVDATADDYNPFPETPLEYVLVAVESGEGEVAITEGVVNVTPAAGFYGNLVVRYVVQDATRDLDRQSEARIYVSVVKEPNAPTKPAVRTVEDGLVVLEWAAPPNNGAPIEGYTVRSDQGTTHACEASICTVDGLANDVTYRFTVTARNRAGESPESPASDPVRPDVRPDQPQPPTLSFGNQSLTVEWITPTSEGSPVQNYTLEISPPPPVGSTQRTGVTGNALTWSNLENGVAYQVKIQAYNSSPEPSTWSDYSAVEIPAGPPDAPIKPTTSLLTSVGSTAKMLVTWNTPSGNGDPVSSYTLEVLRGGAVVNTLTVGAGVNSQTVDVATSETAYTYRVTAANKAGMGAPSVESDARRAVAEPGAPTNIVLTTPNPNGTISISFAAGPLNGIKASEASYEYRLSGQTTWRALVGNTISTGLVLNTTYSVDLRALGTVDGVTYVGAVGTSVPPPAAPYLTPVAPTATPTALPGQVRFQWGDPTLRGRPITKIEYSVNGAAYVPYASVGGGSVTVNVAQGNSASFSLRVTDQEGQQNVSTSPTGYPTPPSATLSHGAKANGATGVNCTSTCWWLQLNVSNFQPGTYRYECWRNTNGVRRLWPELTGKVYNVTVSSSGSYRLRCYSGFTGRIYLIRVMNVSGSPGGDLYTPDVTW